MPISGQSGLDKINYYQYTFNGNDVEDKYVCLFICVFFVFVLCCLCFLYVCMCMCVRHRPNVE